MNTPLESYDFVMTLLAVLVGRLGGQVSIVQADLDGMAGGRLVEQCDGKGPMIVTLELPPPINDRQ